MYCLRMLLPGSCGRRASAVPREGLSLVDDEVRFRADLFRGCAGYYERYRLPYPEAMITDLVRCAQVAEGERLLDLA